MKTEPTSSVGRILQVESTCRQEPLRVNIVGFPDRVEISINSNKYKKKNCSKEEWRDLSPVKVEIRIQ